MHVSNEVERSQKGVFKFLPTLPKEHYKLMYSNPFPLPRYQILIPIPTLIFANISSATLLVLLLDVMLRAPLLGFPLIVPPLRLDLCFPVTRQPRDSSANCTSDPIGHTRPEII